MLELIDVIVKDEDDDEDKLRKIYRDENGVNVCVFVFDYCSFGV